MYYTAKPISLCLLKPRDRLTLILKAFNIKLMPEPRNSASSANTPPIGDSQKAEKYIAWLTDLISKDKLLVNHSDLKKFDISCMEDHYRVNLKDYEVEVSHSKHPETSADMFVLLFNSLQSSTTSSRSILAFVYLTKEQFLKFKVVADDQIERIRKAAEEKRFKEAMHPIDNLLEQISLKEAELTEADKEHLDSNRPNFFEQPAQEESASDQNQASESETEEEPEEDEETEEKPSNQEGGQTAQDSSIPLDEAPPVKEMPTSGSDTAPSVAPPLTTEPTSETPITETKVSEPSPQLPPISSQPSIPKPDQPVTEPPSFQLAPQTPRPTVPENPVPSTPPAMSDQLREAALAAGLPLDNTGPTAPIETSTSTAQAPAASTSSSAQSMGITTPNSSIFADEVPQPNNSPSTQNVYLTGDEANQPIGASPSTVAPVFNPASILNPENITPLNPNSVQST